MHGNERRSPDERFKRPVQKVIGNLCASSTGQHDVGIATVSEHHSSEVLGDVTVVHEQATRARSVLNQVPGGGARGCEYFSRIDTDPNFG
jgi:hypothetical protein